MKLTDLHRRALTILLDQDRIGPHPDSQTDGDTITAACRRELLEAGYVITKPAEDEQVPFYRDGNNRRHRADDLRFIPTHWWRITPSGRDALKTEGRMI